MVCDEGIATDGLLGEPVKLYKVLRKYGYVTILEMVWAENEDQVHYVLNWEREDKPKLEIEEIEEREGCFLSVSVKERNNKMRKKTWYWSIWWWMGYHGLYQINWWLKKHRVIS